MKTDHSFVSTTDALLRSLKDPETAEEVLRVITAEPPDARDPASDAGPGGLIEDDVPTEPPPPEEDEEDPGRAPVFALCPRCSRAANGAAEVELEFGHRTVKKKDADGNVVGSATYIQSYCRACRREKKRKK